VEIVVMDEGMQIKEMANDSQGRKELGARIEAWYSLPS
jgi:hypothetical protein